MAGSGWGAEIVLRPHVVVDRKMVTLGDVAEILGDAPMGLEEVPLCASPFPGERRTLDGSHIQRRLVQNRIRPNMVTLSGAEKVVVEGACVRIGGDRIRTLVEEALRERLSGETIRVTFREVPREVVLPPGPMDLRVRLPDEGALQGHALVYVEALVAGRMVQRIPVSVQVERTIQVVVAKRRLDRHTLITAEDVRMEQRTQRSRAGSLAERLEDVVGRRTKTILPAGRAIRLDLVEVPPILCRGDRVTLMASLKGLTVRTVGEAREDGWKGDIIRVRNLRSGREVQGMVVDSKTVKVRL